MHTYPLRKDQALCHVTQCFILSPKEAELNKNRPQYIKAKEKTAHVLKRIETSK